MRVPKGPKPSNGRPKKPYKKVAQHVKPLSEKLPEEYRVQCKRPADCMDGLPKLLTRPLEWQPTTEHLTVERMEDFKLGTDGFLRNAEVRLFNFIVEQHQEVFAWEETERRRFREDYFPAIKY